MCPARHPLLHSAIHKVMETRPSSLGSRQPEYMTFCRQMWELLYSRTNSKSNLAGTYLTIGGRCVYYKSEKQIIVAYQYAMNHFGLMDIWPICNIGSGQLLPLDVRTGNMVLKVYRI